MQKGVLFVKQRGKINGLYYHKLNKIFIYITLVVLFMLIIYSAFFIRQQKQENDNTIRNVAINKIQLYSTSFEIIQNKIDMFKESDKLLNWVKSENEVEKGFALIKLYKDITTRTSILGDMDYTITVIDPFSDKVICSGGTYDIKNYLKNESGMEFTTLNQTIDSFKISDNDVMQPLYDDNDRLSELYLFSKAEIDDVYVIIVASIHINKILQNQKGINIGFVSSAGDIIEGTQGSFNELKSETIKELAKKTNLNDINIIENNYFLKQLKGLPWTIVVEMVPNNENMIYLVIVLCSFMFLITLSIYFVGMKAKTQLYSPIKEIVDNSPKSNDSIDVDNNDEFAFFKSINERVNSLTTELKMVLEKQEKLIAQKYNLDLIEGIISEKDLLDTTNYFVGYMDADTITKEVNKQLLLQLILELTIGLDENILCIRKDSSKVIFIIKASSLEEASKYIKEMLAKFGEDSEVQVALSDLIIGKKNLQNGFNQVQSLYEYHYSFPSRRILTSDDVKSLSYHSYYYPVYTEKRLVSMLIEGNSHYKKFLEGVVEENKCDKELSHSLKHEFVLSLVSSIRRVFQEIKTTPEDLIGHKIDWLFFNRDNNFDKEIDVIFTICDDIVKSINESTNTNDSQMLSLIIDFIRKHYMEDIKLQDVADLLNITPKYAGTLFSNLSDMNFKSYLTNYRVESAKDIIKKNPKIKVIELSSMVGFNSSNSLIRAFNKEVGMTPKSYANLISRSTK
jgi:YesN/AraC family two-component response regulator